MLWKRNLSWTSYLAELNSLFTTKDLSRFVIDRPGFIRILEEDGENCVRTTVNVENGKFNTTGCVGAEGFYFICEDGTGPHFSKEDIFYIINIE